MTDTPDHVADRERAFWDDEVPSLEELRRQAAHRDDPNVEAMLGALGDLEDARVLDFACGGGVTSVTLARRGAHVTGIDVSGVSVERARDLASELGVEASFEQRSLESFDDASFDGIVGRYALHHVDIASVGPQLARVLRPGGTAAFLETMATNPVLAFSRSRLAGRIPGVPRYGSDDEHPLTGADLDVLGRSFDEVTTTVGELRFVRMFDRQVLRYRSPRLSRLAARTDDALLRRGLHQLSYHQVVVCRRRPERRV